MISPSWRGDFLNSIITQNPQKDKSSADFGDIGFNYSAVVSSAVVSTGAAASTFFTALI